MLAEIIESLQFYEYITENTLYVIRISHLRCIKLSFWSQLFFSAIDINIVCQTE